MGLAGRLLVVVEVGGAAVWVAERAGWRLRGGIWWVGCVVWRLEGWVCGFGGIVFGVFAGFGFVVGFAVVGCC